MERDQASKFINDLLTLMVARKGSDLFITADFPPAIKIDGKVKRLMEQPLVAAHTLTLARSIMSDKQVAEFERTKECNFAISPAGIGRFRVNAFIQQGRVGMVLRTIPSTIPTIDQMGLPQVLKDVGTRRIARAAFEYARQTGKRRVSIVTKANILKKTDGRFTALAHEVAADYPEITVDDWYVDIMAANLVNPSVRRDFQVFLLPNLYGDILTDEAAQIQGGVGTAGSANTGDRYALFEAIHGSAPRLVEAGLAAYANPTSILAATVLMLQHIGRTAAAERLTCALGTCPLVVDGTAQGATCEAFTRALSFER